VQLADQVELDCEGSMHLNGHSQQPAQEQRPAKPVQIEVVRVQAGASALFRILSPSYGGLFTHFKGRSKYCPGEDFCLLHKMDRIWKGYCAAEWWLEKEKVWRPCVLEITESLELDMRGKFGRGQVWEVYREQRTSKKAPQVMGKLHETVDVSRLRPPFDVVPVLRALYHSDVIDLSKKNPCAPRLLAEDVSDDPPAILASKPVQAMDPAEYEARRKQLDDLFNKNRTTPHERRKTLNGK
jgi:hypothetical protein